MSYFPQGLAMGETFCNREDERKKIALSIETHENIVLTAPRRYGKTSLLQQVLKENNFHGKSMDFFFVLNEDDILKILTEAVSHIIHSMLPKTKKAYQKIIDNIAACNPKLIFNFMGQKLEIRIKQKSEKSISELLLTLNQVAEETHSFCVLVFDEFQQISELKDNHKIEALIRHAVERSQNVSYIFCGSKRHLLSGMFNDKARPLYHLCDLMTIDRISTSCYLKFINKFSLKQWKKILDSNVCEEILLLTENHPYYVNALCRALWKNENIPEIKNVRETWQGLVAQQSTWIRDEIDALTLNRKKILKTLADNPTNEPQGQVFSRKAGLNPSGIKAALDYLMDADLVYQKPDKKYYILDPAMAYYIREYMG